MDTYTLIAVGWLALLSAGFFAHFLHNRVNNLIILKDRLKAVALVEDISWERSGPERRGAFRRSGRGKYVVHIFYVIDGKEYRSELYYTLLPPERFVEGGKIKVYCQKSKPGNCMEARLFPTGDNSLASLLMCGVFSWLAWFVLNSYQPTQPVEKIAMGVGQIAGVLVFVALALAFVGIFAWYQWRKTAIRKNPLEVEATIENVRATKSDYGIGCRAYLSYVVDKKTYYAKVGLTKNETAQYKLGDKINIYCLKQTPHIIAKDLHGTLHYFAWAGTVVMLIAARAVYLM